jgi:peptidyl-prolyl cis-trans isomerase B (cyclophilin B)
VASAASTQQLNLVQADRSAHRVTIDTARGQIVMDVCPDLMPVTVTNFDKLVKEGFYNGLTFHRVEDWVVQGGDPKGDGTGGSGQTIKLETNPQLKNLRGAVAMARSGDPNSASSQFYILKKDTPSLDGQYAVFGMVVQGMDVVDQIQIGDKMTSVKE